MYVYVYLCTPAPVALVTLCDALRTSSLDYWPAPERAMGQLPPFIIKFKHKIKPNKMTVEQDNKVRKMHW